jgi:DNA-binding transcriptional ArsR family regulator
MDGHKLGSKVAKALAHPVRLQILEVLDREGESCVCHLEHRLGQRQAYISQHLARLRDAGLVVDRRQGLNVFYALQLDTAGRLLKELREAVFTLAQGERQQVHYHELRGPPDVACPCPRCTERVIVENQETEYGGA